MTVIYALCHPETLEIRYVGKSVRPEIRLCEHIDGAARGHCHVHSWIRSLPSDPVMKFLEEDPADSNEAERRWIALLRSRGARLTNHTDGGDGGSGKVSPEARAKISAALRGVPLTKEHREKLSRAHRGKKLSDAHKLQVSLSGKARKLKLSAERRAKIGDDHRGKVVSQETGRRISTAHKIRFEEEPLARWKTAHTRYHGASPNEECLLCRSS